jgi:hypothetical protein
MTSINPITLNTPLFYIFAISLQLLSGCSQWNSDPTRLQADYGQSVRAMVSNQLYNPSKSQAPAALAPDGIEANKADSLLTGYRTDIGKAGNVGHSALGAPGLANQGGTGASSR